MIYSREIARVTFQRIRKSLQVLISAPYRSYRLRAVKRSRRIAAPNGIDSLESLDLGGVRQWICVRGRDATKPVLLFLQGGIDTPAFINVSFLGINARLEESFVMVYWERRGIGKSYSGKCARQTATIEQTVSDTLELAQVLRERFAVSKIYLAGHSWGAAMAMLAAASRPDLFYAVASSGQVVNTTEDVTMNYQYALDEAVKAGDAGATRELKITGSPPYDYRKHLIYTKWASRYRGISYSIKGKSGNGRPHGADHRWRRLSGVFTAEPLVPEYSLRNAFSMALRPDVSMKCIGEGFYDLDLFRQVPEIHVPVYFLQGKYERITPPEIVERYYNHLRAPRGKHLIWFETTAHAPYMKHPDEFRDVLVNKVLRETYDSFPV